MPGEGGGGGDLFICLFIFIEYITEKTNATYNETYKLKHDVIGS